LKENTNDSNQYLGFLDTAAVFTTQTNPCTQDLFQLQNTEKSGIKLPVLKNTLMLGKRAEVFFKHQLEKDNKYKLLLENIQIQHNKITRGELDFILEENKSLKKIHVEVSYKFYLYDPRIEGDEIQKWIGPNRNDNLIKKITKLQTHQFPLLYSEEAKKTLNDLKVDAIQQQLFFKAQLYIPFDLKDTSFTSINPKAIKGFYRNYEKFIKEDHTHALFHIPKKQDWLAAPESNENWFSFDSIAQELCSAIEKQKAPLIWVQRNNSDCTRLFITWW